MLELMITAARQREAARQAELERQQRENEAEKRRLRITELKQHIVFDLGAEFLEVGTLEYREEGETAVLNLEYQGRHVWLYRLTQWSPSTSYWHVRTRGTETDTILGREILVVQERARVRDDVLCAIADLVGRKNLDYIINPDA